MVLDALVYYKRLLVRLLGTDEATRHERETLQAECLQGLRKLQEVDPMRKQRYKDIGQCSSSARHILDALAWWCGVARRAGSLTR